MKVAEWFACVLLVDRYAMMPQKRACRFGYDARCCSGGVDLVGAV